MPTGAVEIVSFCPCSLLATKPNFAKQVCQSGAICILSCGVEQEIERAESRIVWIALAILHDYLPLKTSRNSLRVILILRGAQRGARGPASCPAEVTAWPPDRV